MGAVTFDPSGYDLSVRPLAPTAVVRVEDDGTLTPLPDVTWTEIRRDEGADPGSATLRVRMGYTVGSPDYRGFAQGATLNRPAWGSLTIDDRVAIGAIRPDGQTDWIFQGFVQVPSGTLSPEASEVSVTAQGVAVRWWDRPLWGAVVRDPGEPFSTADPDQYRTQRDVRCNPQGEANCTPDEKDVGADGRKYPVFLDDRVPYENTASGERVEVRTQWTLGRLARYVLYAPDETGKSDETYLKLPDSDSVDAFLEAKIPKDPGKWDPKDPTTYESKPVPVKDVSPHFAPRPETLDRLLSPHGVKIAFRTLTLAGKPVEYLRIYRTDAAAGQVVKDLVLQEPGPLATAANQAESIRLDRDASRIVNSWRVLGGPGKVEAGFVLSPLWKLDPAMKDVQDQFRLDKAEARDAPKWARIAFRDWGLDESGEGHWRFGDLSGEEPIPGLGSWFRGEPTSLDGLFGDPGRDPEGRLTPNYAPWRRPGTGHLVSKDALGSPYRAELCLLFGYAPTAPGIWDGTGTVFPVAGSWRLLHDRLGIRITAEKPNAWKIGSQAEDSRLDAGHLRAVERLLDPDPAKRFRLLLTTVVQTDKQTIATAGRRKSSPTRFETVGAVDRSGRYRLQAVHPSSRYHATPGSGKMTILRDDGPEQFAEATARRSAHESAPAAGSIVVPRLMTSILLGDRIREVRPRGVKLGGTVEPDGKSVVYPRVVGITWANDPERGITTTFRINDRRGEMAQVEGDVEEV